MGATELVVLSVERCRSEEAYERGSCLAAASPALRRRASHMNFSLALAARSTSEWWFLTQGFEGSCAAPLYFKRSDKSQIAALGRVTFLSTRALGPAS